MVKTYAVARNVRMSSRKVKLVLDMIRGKNALQALDILCFVNKGAVAPVVKVIQSALANAAHNHKATREQMIIASCYADMGPTIHRFSPKAMGRAGAIRKRTCHIWVFLTDGKIESRISNLEFGKGKDKKDKKGDVKKNEKPAVDKVAKKLLVSKKPAFLAKKK